MRPGVSVRSGITMYGFDARNSSTCPRSDRRCSWARSALAHHADVRSSAASGNVCLVAAGTGTERVWWEDGFPLAMLLACSFSLCPCGPHELVARRSLVADRLECWLRRGRPHHGGRHAAALAAEPRPRLAG